MAADHVHARAGNPRQEYSLATYVRAWQASSYRAHITAGECKKYDFPGRL